MSYYLGLDQGTTGTTALVLNEKWELCSKGYKEHTQYFPKPGWVEHDPVEIWQKTKESIAIALNKAGINAEDLKVLGLANQGETCMVWDKNTGEPIYNAIVWQDRRTAKTADRFKEKWGKLITEKTGLPVDAYFSALKIKWILDHVENAMTRAEKGELLAGTLDSWLIWKLSGRELFVTDPSTASRTLLFNIHTGQWDAWLLDIMSIPERILPVIKDSVMVYGYTSPHEFLNASIPIAGSVTDQAAALFGQTCFHKGAVKNTYGTGCFMLMNTGDQPVYSSNGLITTVVWSKNAKITFALDAGVYIAGAAIQWLRDGIKIIKSIDETEALARTVADTGGVFFVPAFVGLAAPYWDQYARGTMVGITRGTTKAHIVRATLEAIAYQVAENLEVMRLDSNEPIVNMRVDGGAVVNEFLMQFQADILGIPVDVPEINETTALGAAYLAALAIGDFSDLTEISSHWKLFKRYEPTFTEDKRKTLTSRWKKAVARSRNWAVD